MKLICQAVIRMLGMMMLASGASAQLQPLCSVNITDVNFGVIADTKQSIIQDTQATVSFQCVFPAGLLLSNVRFCVNIGDGSVENYFSKPGGFRKADAGENRKLTYDLYTNAGRSTVWGSNYHNIGGAGPYEHVMNTGLINILLGGTVNSTATLYARAFVDKKLKGGVYTSNFSGGEVVVDYGNGNSLTNCNSVPLGAQQTSATFNVAAIISNSCLVSATPLDFGSLSALNAPRDATSNVVVQCQAGQEYEVTLSEGDGRGATESNRRMTRIGGNDVVNYQLYRNAARTQNWGNTPGSNSVDGTGTGFPEILPVYGRIPPQATPPTGDYQDTIVVEISF